MDIVKWMTLSKLKQNKWHNADKMGELPPKSWFGSMNSKAKGAARSIGKFFKYIILY